jgi:hypothetical protein
MPKSLLGLSQIVGKLGPVNALIEAERNPFEILVWYMTGD